MTRKHVLYGLRYSPWTERARFALDVCDVQHTMQGHQPILGELTLRLKAKSLSHKTVPILVTASGDVIKDSFDIARFAWASTPQLWEQWQTHEKAIMDAYALSERILNLSRLFALKRMKESPKTLEAQVPRWMPMKAAVGSMGVNLFAYKYGLDMPTAIDRESLNQALLALKEKILDRQYVSDQFSMADILLAVSLGAILPVSNEHIRINRGIRDAWTDEVSVSNFPEVFEWRDNIYQKHRKRK